MKDFEKTVYEYCLKEKLLEKGASLVVGVSGGADSVCLLHVLDSFKDILELKITAVHINHGLRETAAHDADYAVKLCGEHGISCRVFNYDVEEIAASGGLSLEEAGRMVRYEAFEKVRVETSSSVIAVAHHRDDQAETILLNLLRGSGARGLGGMSPRRDKIIRPLLAVSRKMIEEYLAQENIPFCIDETNLECDYTRNKIRNILLPMLEAEYNAGAVDHIVTAGDITGRMERYVSDQADRAYDTAVNEKNDEHQLIINEKEIRLLDPVISELVMKKALGRIAGTVKDIGRVHIESLSELLDNQAGKSIDLPYRMKALRVYEGIKLYKTDPGAGSVENSAEEETPAEIKLDAPEGVYPCGKGSIHVALLNLTKTDEWRRFTEQKEYNKCFDYDIIESNLTIRTRRAGDYLTVDEKGGSQKLKNYFINAKIPGEMRNDIPLICEGSSVLWVVGHRISEKYKVTADTQKVLVVTYKL